MGNLYQQRASHRTVHIVFLANDRCLRDYDLVVAHCWPDGLELTPGFYRASITDCLRRLLNTQAYLFASY